MRRIRLVDELKRVRPTLEDPESAITSGRVRVEGSLVLNPASMVRPGCAIVVEKPVELRGSAKLRAAIDAFGVNVRGRICLDIGASTGGFTTVLLERGAARVYAVDVGHGQLLGSLRQDRRVVNLESTNVAELDRAIVPDAIDLVTVDVSYLALGGAVSQLDAIEITVGAELVGLIKPMFELGLATAPTDHISLDEATVRAVDIIERSGWDMIATIPSRVTGAKGAVEGFVHARRRG